jgi:putative transposase
MDIAVSHKIRLVPNKSQEDYFRKACGTARFTYNWALAGWQRLYEAGEKPSAFALKKQFNSIKREAFPWTYEVTKSAPEQAFADLNRAFQNFFSKMAKYPKFKKKNRAKDSFYLANDQFALSGKKVRIPKLGWVRMREELRFEGKILAARVSRTADQWHISVQVKTLRPIPTPKNQGCVGIDLGIKTFAMLSNGRALHAPKPIVTLQKKLKRLSKKHSHKQLGSNNRKKSTMKLAKLHNRISCIRKDFLHKLSSAIAKDVEVVVIEDLNTSGMMRNHKLAKHISDASFSEFRRQLMYKKDLYGGKLVTADRFFPSSKTCSICGCIKADLTLADRTYECLSCGSKLDRDFNASLNLYTLGLREINACGQNDLCIYQPMEDISQLVEAGIKSGLIEINRN